MDEVGANGGGNNRAFELARCKLEQLCEDFDYREHSLESRWDDAYLDERQREIRQEEAKNDFRTNVLEIVRNHPSLAREVFHFPHLGKESLLTIFVHAGFELDIVKSIYNMEPSALTDNGGDHDPLMVACTNPRVSEDIVHFLAKQIPEGLKELRGDFFPLFYLLHSRAANRNLSSLSLLKALVSLYPYSGKIVGFRGKASSQNDREEILLVEALFNLGYNADFLEYAISIMPDTFKRVQIAGFMHGSPWQLDLDRAKVLVKILPKIRELDLKMVEWALDGFLQVLDQLSSGMTSTVENLSISLPPYKTLESSPQALDVLRKLVNSRSALRRLLLSAFHEDESMEHSVLIRAMVATAGNEKEPARRLESLELRDFVFPTCEALGDFLVSKSLPPNFGLSCVDIKGDSWNVEVNWNSCQVEKLEIDEPLFANNDCMLGFLHDLGWMPRLKTLTLTHTIAPEITIPILEQASSMPELRKLVVTIKPSGADADLTAPLVALLLHTRLQELRIHVRGGQQCGVDFLLLWLVLLVQGNDSRLEVLELPFALQAAKPRNLLLLLVKKHNFTLKEITIYDTKNTYIGNLTKTDKKLFDPDYAKNVEYYLRLNRLGRGRLRQEDVTMTEFIGILVAANEASDCTDLENFSSIYELLGEAPRFLSS